ncbi:MAG TPA: aminotransferase class I/II-fold pyridoxal phosphate-dependent enzyme, partial [Hydrogenobaculum sp.]|nr:aminotransferase class I/II-fold pyridoxal phosphate-dependent enzyme [Hydrogenobaculum sp.]
PNNPTSAKAPDSFYKKLIEFAHKYGIIIASDLAYSEIYISEPPRSILEFEGAKDVAIEFHSLSKTYNMTGWRIGMAVGNPSLIAGLGKIKTNVDSGQFQAIQEAGIKALSLDDSIVQNLRDIYKERRTVMTEALKAINLDVFESDATFYLWIKVPKGFTSASFAELLLDKLAIVVTPGSGFGEAGEGYFRISLTVDTNRLKEAADRIKTLSL